MSFDIALTDKLSLFVEDMRRGGVECLPPDANRSEAAFAVEDGKVRYALGALKGVGEKAMQALVAERKANGPFKSLDDFAERIDPRLLNRRQIESLAAAGAFASIAPDRAAVFASAETILAHASSAADQRTSGQHGLFGGSSSAVAPMRLANAEEWSLAQRMAAERDSFGFYFSSHPVESHRHLLDANRARTFAQLAEMPMPAEGRAGATMAALVEESRWRVSQKGRRYLMATLSDQSGQFQATVFDDEASTAIEAAAKAGTCGLLTVELDKREGDDLPRVAIKRFQPLESLAKRTRLQMEIRIASAQLVGAVARELAGATGGGGIVRMRLPLASSGEAVVIVGRDFALDAELQARIERITGEGSVDLSVQEPPRLALVG
jgi:DNA polymerase-3 subunit alpha